MDHAIYTAMGAASQTLNQQSVTASNLANASTPGFRAQLSALRAVPVEGLSLPTRTLVAETTPGADMTPGDLNYTYAHWMLPCNRMVGWRCRARMVPKGIPVTVTFRSHRPGN